MNPRADDNNSPHGGTAKTVCLDCGCEFQTVGRGRDQHVCPICSAQPDRTDAPNEAGWERVLKPRPPGQQKIDFPGHSPGSIEVEATSASRSVPDQPFPRPHFEEHQVDAAPPTEARPSEAAPPKQPGQAPPPRSEESTGAFFEVLRDLGFQIADDRASEDADG